MKTEVKIAEFKSKLSKYLRAAQQGREIVVKDRDTPIARLVRYVPPRQRLETIPPTKSLKEAEEMIKRSPRPKNLKPGDLEEVLRWDRRDRFDTDSL